MAGDAAAAAAAAETQVADGEASQAGEAGKSAKEEGGGAANLVGSGKLASDPWQPPQPATAKEIVVSVIAEIEDNTATAWTLTHPRAGALLQVATSWGERHACPAAGVGLELDPDFAAAAAMGSGGSSSSSAPGRGALLDLSSTPDDLGWSKWQHVCLFAVPVDAPASSAATAAASIASPAAATGKTKRQAVPGPGRAAKAAKLNGFPENTSDLPGHDEPIEYLQDNPKKRGSAGHQRYEQYRSAKTLREALELGSAKGDLTHDWKKGYIRRRQ